MIAWTGVMALLLLFFLSLLAEVSSSSTEAEWQTWGPYRPNLYFGVRPLVPESFLMGLMWASGESQSEMLKS
jgi:mannosyl-oligosaccharide glucosidase